MKGASRRGARARPRVLGICLSEATLDLVRPFAAAGELPAFRSLLEEGASGTVSYGLPCLLTPQTWATIHTGRSAGHHGVFDYWQRGRDGRFRRTDGRDLRVPTFWKLLSDQGVRCALVNLPWTYPPQPIDGFVLAGQDAPGAHPSIAWPRALYRELCRRFGPYRLKDAFPGGQRCEEYARRVPAEARRRTDVLEHLVRSTDWQLFLCYFSESAMAQHYFWRDMEEGGEQAGVVPETYRALDEAIARLRAAAGPETVVLVLSECGAGPIRSGVRINAFLERMGYLEHTPRPREQRLFSDLRGLAQRRLPKSLFYWVNRAGVASWVQERTSLGGLAPERTRVFHRGKGEGNLYVNLKGRDPHGVVAPGAEYEELCASVARDLRTLCDPETGAPVVRAVHRSNELFAGPEADRAPDMVVEWVDFAYMPDERPAADDAVFAERVREYMSWPTSGSHRMPGVLLAGGPGVAAGRALGDHRLLDLAPTICRLLGRDAPPEAEGRVIEELFA